MGWILFKLFVPFMELIKWEKQIRAHMLRHLQLYAAVGIGSEMNYWIG